ncbi:MAG TPA: hypothetical protein VHZ51_08075 [Ktedonobacteraceae bacterium]|nr:hypothetical protein [Ktedonobacteraceae bacterium]
MAYKTHNTCRPRFYRGHAQLIAQGWGRPITQRDNGACRPNNTDQRAP